MPGAATVRCFVGAFVAPASAGDLVAVQNALGGAGGRAPGRRVPVDNLHVTLNFIGDVPELVVPELCQALRVLDRRDLVVRVSGYCGFPRPRQARMVVAELAPHPLLTRWHEELARVLGSERRPFRPHITLCRLRRPRPFPTRVQSPPLEVTLQAPWLYRSDQIPGGVRYRPV